MQTSKISRILWPLRRSPHPMERRRVDEIDAQLDRTPQNCFAFSRSGGQPQITSAVRRIAPKPRRLTNRSPPNKNVSPLLPVLAAATIFCNPPVRTPAAPARLASFVASSHLNYVAYINYRPSRRKSIPKEGPDRDDWKRASRDSRALIDICGLGRKER